MKKIITDDKELKAFEVGAGRFLKLAQQKDTEFLNSEERRIGGVKDADGRTIQKGTLEESREMFQQSLHETLLATKLPESLGSTADILGASHSVLAELEKDGKIGRDDYDLEYMKRMEEKLTGGKGFTTDQRDKFEDVIYDSPVKKRLEYYTGELGYKKDLTAQKLLEQVKKDYESQFEGETMDLGKIGTVMAWETMATKKLAANEEFTVDKYNKKEFSLMTDLYETIIKDPQDTPAIRQRLEDLRQNTNLSPEEFRNTMKEKTGVDIWDGQDVGRDTKAIKDEALKHTDYLAIMANRFNAKVTIPDKYK